MKDQGIRYELPYQERIARMGAELGSRLHSREINWWDKQIEEYKSLPDCLDFSKIYETDPQYDLWLITARSMQFAWSSNVEISWMIEAAKELREHGGVVMNGKTAKKRGISHGDMVWVEAPLGKVKAKALVREGIRPDTLLMVAQFGQKKTPVAKDLGWPNMNPLIPITLATTDSTGSSSDHLKVKLYKS